LKTMRRQRSRRRGKEEREGKRKEAKMRRDRDLNPGAQSAGASNVSMRRQ
jgi:hypothetical protein